MVDKLAFQQIIIAVSEVIREVKETPSGAVYNALLMRYPRLTSNEYQLVIDSLVSAKLIEQKHFVLRWIGPAVADGKPL